MVAGGLGEINAIKDRLERAQGNASRTTEELNKIKAALWRAYRTAKYEDTKAKQDVLDAEKALREAEKKYNLVEVGINNEKKTNCTGKKRDVSELSLTIDEEGTRTSSEQSDTNSVRKFTATPVRRCKCTCWLGTSSGDEPSPEI
jgi:hypothetical protein